MTIKTTEAASTAEVLNTENLAKVLLVLEVGPPAIAAWRLATPTMRNYYRDRALLIATLLAELEGRPTP